MGSIFISTEGDASLTFKKVYEMADLKKNCIAIFSRGKGIAKSYLPHKSTGYIGETEYAKGLKILLFIYAEEKFRRP